MENIEKLLEEQEKRMTPYELKLKKIDQTIANFAFNYQKKETLVRFMVKMKSEMSAYDAQIEKIRVDTLNTDIYLERFLEVKMLNLIHDMTESSISNYSDRKEFLTNLNKRFKELEKRILEDSQIDAKA